MTDTPPSQGRSIISEELPFRDQTARLVGALNPNGTASFVVDDITTTSQLPNSTPRSLKAALDAAAGARRNSGATTPDSVSEEDYDTLRHDPLTVVVGGKGAGFDGHGTLDAASGQTGALEKPNSPLQSVKKHRPILPALKSIPITLQKAEKKGQYYLITEDAQLKEILKLGLERVCSTIQ
jgi:sterol O-acyltransferase